MNIDFLRKGLKKDLPIRGLRGNIYFTSDPKIKEIYLANDDGSMSLYSSQIHADTKCTYNADGDLEKFEEIISNVTIRTTTFTYNADKNIEKIVEKYNGKTITTNFIYTNKILTNTTKVES